MLASCVIWSSALHSSDLLIPYLIALPVSHITTQHTDIYHYYFKHTQLKILVDHSDPAFIQDRIDGLNHFLRMIINLPHVSDMTCVRGFLGVMDRVVEYSTVFFTPTMGLTLDAPSTVGSVQVSLVLA